MLLNQLQRPVQVPADLLLHADHVRARLRKRGNKLVGILDHQVAIERQLRHRPQRLHHRRPKRNVRHKMPIHHVHMHDRPAPTLRRGHLIGQMRKI